MDRQQMGDLDLCASRVEWNSRVLLMWRERRCGTACRYGLGLTWPIGLEQSWGSEHVEL